VSDAKNDLIEKINKMNLGELWVIHTTATTTGRFISAFGILLILVALIVGNLFTYVACGGLVYVLGHLAVGADKTKLVIEERILKLDPDK
jgi:hypothetical protein